MTPGTPPRRLRVLFRAYAGDNSKPRQPFYSKQLAVVSLIRAAQRVDPAPELVFLTDGTMPAERLLVMAAHGEVVPVKGGSDARSYREMLAREAALHGADDDIIWFSEDDYLYGPDALVQLVAGASAFPRADYFSLSACRALDTTHGPGRRARDRAQPGAAGDPAAVMVGDVAWFRATASTSTFGTVRRVLREDVHLLRQMALTGGAWDNTTCQVMQGYLPFSVAELRADLLPVGVAPSGWPRALARGGIRVYANARALRRASRRRSMMGTDPELVLHMEDPNVDLRAQSGITLAVDWAQIAADTVEWAREQATPMHLPSIPSSTP